ncbi:MAG TPA: hypothetical protein VNG33_11135 [Polyangiaceae bacterium]|nr:hypothetical protein [Polyangiaceae bacterium]
MSDQTVIPADALFDRTYALQVEDMVITDLNIQFNVKRSLSAKISGRCDLVISNLSEETRKRLHAMREVFVSLEAGYADTGRSLIFRGDLSEAWSARENTEWTTTITSDDGGRKKKSARVQRNYAPGTSLAKIITDIAAAMHVGAGNVASVADAARYWKTGQASVGKGITTSGAAVAQLDRITRSCGLSWSIQDGELQFLPTRHAALPDPPILLSPHSGLIESPELGKDQLVKARTLMLPGLYPGRQVELATRYVSGVYRVDTVTYKGEWSGASWGTELELSAIKR